MVLDRQIMLPFVMLFVALCWTCVRLVRNTHTNIHAGDVDASCYTKSCCDATDVDDASYDSLVD